MNEYTVTLTVHTERGHGETLSELVTAIRHDDEISDIQVVHGILEWVKFVENPCPYTFAHTKTWCGYDGCREG